MRYEYISFLPNLEGVTIFYSVLIAGCITLPVYITLMVFRCTLRVATTRTASTSKMNTRAGVRLALFYRSFENERIN